MHLKLSLTLLLLACEFLLITENLKANGNQSLPTSGENQQNKTSADAQHPHQALIPIEVQRCTNTQQKQAKNEPENSAWWPSQLGTMADLCVAMAAIWAGCIALRTLKGIERQVKANIIAARAAKSANRIARDALILSNRPYIQVTYEDPGLRLTPIMRTPDCIVLIYKNVGRTPAIISDMQFGYMIYPYEDPWPINPIFDGPIIEDFLHHGASISTTRRPAISDLDFQHVKERSKKLIIFGYVDYRDTLDNRYRLGFGWYCVHDEEESPNEPNLRNIPDKTYNYDRHRKQGEGHDWYT